MRLRMRTIIAIMVIPIIIAILLVPPYLAWADYEPDSYVAPAPYPDWEYPYERGYEWTIEWETEIFYDSDGGLTTSNPATGIKTTDLRVEYEKFDVYDIWLPSDTIIVTPEKPSFLDYVIAYYSIGNRTLELYNGELCVIKLSCWFTSAWDTTTHIDLTDDPSTKDRVVNVNEIGSYSDAFTLYTRLYSGTYTFSLVVLANPPIYNVNIGWDTIILKVVNPYEK